MSKLRDQHKAFAEWFLQQNPIAPNVEDMAWAAWKAALAQPETESEPVAWQRRYILPAGPSGWQDCAPEDVEHYRSRVGEVEVRPLYAPPPRDEWRPASEPPEDDRDVVLFVKAGSASRIAVGHFKGGYWWLHSRLSSDVPVITHWRDVTPPTEGE